MGELCLKGLELKVGVLGGHRVRGRDDCRRRAVLLLFAVVDLHGERFDKHQRLAALVAHQADRTLLDDIV